ncbi:hypothetical protein SAMN04488100_10290 [Alkalibacterium putridalgicola]|uniref:Uncharacterized protein n=1 Tax=Alkalibacterium putridalgicola TaxID=426703 RepID=A0A1H7QQ11_9LACT|nr:anti-phage protein KwaA [Alkalibacterium putridalgicola]GEK88380.1 hypothetical protein APU01nite_04190 [Alkalibacterium putridalgicola]SEL50066.1 hypothetical protein SAMN04488100_10290 [Alkalibacterium putridalgicola]
MKMKETIMKFCFYLISLSPLFLLLIVLETDLKASFRDNSFSIFSSLVLLISIIALLYLNDLRRDGKNLPLTITKVTDINYEHLTFLATYIIPLVAIPLETLREKTVFIILLVFMGAIFVRTNIFYSNPSLAILGFNVYQFTDSSGAYSESIIIVRGNIKVNDKVKCLKLSSNIYFGKKLKKRSQ